MANQAPMNLLTNSLSNCCAFVHNSVCDVPMRLVVDENQDLHVVRRADAVFPDTMSCSLRPGMTRLDVLLALSLLLTGLVAKIELHTRRQRTVRGGA